MVRAWPWLMGLLLMVQLLVGPQAPAALAQSAMKSEGRVERYRDPTWAFTKSAILPGWGQFGNEQPNKGYAFVATASLGLLLVGRVFGLAQSESGVDFERGIGWILYGTALAWSSIDAYRGAELLNRANGYDLARVPDREVRLSLLRVQF